MSGTAPSDFGDFEFGVSPFGGMQTTGITTPVEPIPSLGGTTIAPLSGVQYAARLADLFPRGWCSDDAKLSGNVYALLLAIGNGLQIVQTELQYALYAQRLQSETSPELDLASLDFYGGSFSRPAGMSDATYAAQIIASLFRAAATRPALQDALAQLTGFEPRMLEPWSVNDTGAWRNFSYWNVDTVQNPARWGNGGLRYQGYIETAPPQIPAIGPNNPVLTWGTAYWNVPGYFFGILPPVDVNAVNDLINRLRAYGTTVWVKIVAPGSLATAVAPTEVMNLAPVAGGPNTILLTWSAPATGSPPYTFSVFYRQTGTVNFVPGPTSTADSVTVSNLSPGTSYDLQVTARNIAGSATSSIVSVTTSLVPPSPAFNLQATIVQSTAITITWSAPLSGTPPFTYTALYRPSGTTTWQSLIVGQALAVTVINLQPLTAYDFEIQTSN